MDCHLFLFPPVLLISTSKTCRKTPTSEILSVLDYELDQLFNTSSNVTGNSKTSTLSTLSISASEKHVFAYCILNCETVKKIRFLILLTAAPHALGL